MANVQTVPTRVSGIVAANRTPSQSTSSFATPANYASVSALRAALTAANGAYYTSARLDKLSVNDMIWALRSIQDPATISSKFVAQTA